MTFNQEEKDRFIKTVRDNIVCALNKASSKSKPGSHMTKSELATLLGITPQQLFKILKNGNPTLATIWQISTALNVLPESLFAGTKQGQKKRIEPNMEKMLNDRKKQS